MHETYLRYDWKGFRAGLDIHDKLLTYAWDIILMYAWDMPHMA